MKEFFMEHWTDIVIGIVILIGVIKQLKDGGKQQVLKLVYELAMKIEDDYGQKIGKEKYDQFWLLINDRINEFPPLTRIVIKLFVNKKTMEKWRVEIVEHIDKLIGKKHEETKDIANTVKDVLIKEATKIAIDGKIDREDLIKLGVNLSEEVSDGYINGFAKLKKTWDKPAEIEAGVVFGKKF